MLKHFMIVLPSGRSARLASLYELFGLRNCELSLVLCADPNEAIWAPWDRLKLPTDALPMLTHCFSRLVA